MVVQYQYLKRGQYLSIRWNLPNLKETSREYSISEFPKIINIEFQ